MLSAFIDYCVATQQCPVGQLVYQWQRLTVPLVLSETYPQTNHNSNR